MDPLKNIIAATDFSTAARHAADRAAIVAGQTSAGLELLHVLKSGLMDRLRSLVGDPSSDWEQRLHQHAETQLKGLAAELTNADGAAPERRLTRGELLETIAGEAERLSAGLIVIGSRGAGFMRHLLLGSTAERLLGKTTRSILLVRHAAYAPYRRALVAVDFSTSSLPAIRAARAVAPQAALILLHAYEVPFERQLLLAGVDAETLDHCRAAAKQSAYESLNALSRAAGLEPESAALHVVAGDATRVILEYEQLLDCDLVVMGKHGEDRLDELLLGGVTRHVLSESVGDVLVVAGADSPTRGV
ncbi:MAG: universal stress protein [Planctomyces sp.]|nr:universal stress protein [Planctomyces sp.]